VIVEVGGGWYRSSAKWWILSLQPVRPTPSFFFRLFSPTPIVVTGTVVIAVQHIRTGLQLHQLPHPTDTPDTVIAVDPCCHFLSLSSSSSSHLGH